MAQWRFLVLSNGADQPPIEQQVDCNSLGEALNEAEDWLALHGDPEDETLLADLQRVGARYSERAHVTIVLVPLNEV